MTLVEPAATSAIQALLSSALGWLQRRWSRRRKVREQTLADCERLLYVMAECAQKMTLVVAAYRPHQRPSTVLPQLAQFSGLVAEQEQLLRTLHTHLELRESLEKLAGIAIEAGEFLRSASRWHGFRQEQWQDIFERWAIQRREFDSAAREVFA
jgi:hypothetical protein